jgi:hypothetical protein
MCKYDGDYNWLWVCFNIYYFLDFKLILLHCLSLDSCCLLSIYRRELIECATMAEIIIGWGFALIRLFLNFNIWWSLVNSFCFNLYRFWEHIFHNLLFILWCCRRGYDFDLRLDLLCSEFHAIKLLSTLYFLFFTSRFYFLSFFDINSFIDNREMHLSCFAAGKDVSKSRMTW